MEQITARGKLCKDTAKRIVANSMSPMTYNSNKLSECLKAKKWSAKFHILDNLKNKKKSSLKLTAYIDFNTGRNITMAVKETVPTTTDTDESAPVFKQSADQTGTLSSNTPKACAAKTVRPTEAKQLLIS